MKNLGNITNPQDIATKGYVDGEIAEISTALEVIASALTDLNSRLEALEALQNESNV